MIFLSKIPGVVLVVLGATCLSFGGIIVKSFEGANLWQISFWRHLFFAIFVILYLLAVYKKNFFTAFYKSGLQGFAAGFFLSLGFSAYVFAMYNTTVANTLFIITTETLFLAIFGFIFLKEKINLATFIAIILGMLGVLIIVGSSLSTQTDQQLIGNLVAFTMPISFAILIIIIRKNSKVDMVPSQFIAATFATVTAFLVVVSSSSEFSLIGSKLYMSKHDFVLAFIAGVFQVGFGFILITIGSKNTPAAVVGVMMLAEAVLGPFWAWIFLNEVTPITVLIGGGIILFSILLQSFYTNNKR